MIQINYTQKRSILNSAKAKRIALLPIEYVNNHIECRKREFIWIPNAAIIEITGWCVFVKDWYLDMSDDLRGIISENSDLPIIRKGKTKQECYDQN